MGVRGSPSGSATESYQCLDAKINSIPKSSVVFCFCATNAPPSNTKNLKGSGVTHQEPCNHIYHMTSRLGVK